MQLRKSVSMKGNFDVEFEKEKESSSKHCTSELGQTCKNENINRQERV